MLVQAKDCEKKAEIANIKMLNLSFFIAFKSFIYAKIRIKKIKQRIKKLFLCFIKLFLYFIFLTLCFILSKSSCLQSLFVFLFLRCTFHFEDLTHLLFQCFDFLVFLTKLVLRHYERLFLLP